MYTVVLEQDLIVQKPVGADYLDVDSWVPVKNSLKAIANLYRQDFRIVVFSMYRELDSEAQNFMAFNQILQKMLDAIRKAGGDVNAIFIGNGKPEGNDGEQPAEILSDLFDRLRESPKEVFVVGQSLEVAEAAREAGAKPFLIGMEVSQKSDVPVLENLSEFAELLQSSRVER